MSPTIVVTKENKPAASKFNFQPTIIIQLPMAKSKGANVWFKIEDQVHQFVFFLLFKFLANFVLEPKAKVNHIRR